MFSTRNDNKYGWSSMSKSRTDIHEVKSHNKKGASKPLEKPKKISVPELQEFEPEQKKNMYTYI